MRKIYTIQKGKIIVLLFVVLFIISSTISSYAQNPGDFRSTGSGNWNDPTTWERFDGAGNWDLAGTGANNPGTFPVGTPTGGESVFIQSTHIVTLTVNQSCSDLNIAKGTTTTVNASGRVALGSNTLSVFGILRNYSNDIGTVDPGLPDDAVNYNRYPFTAAAGGKVSVEGLSRTLFNVGQWGVTINAAANGAFPLVINVDAGETVEADAGFKVSSFVVNTGTFEAKTRIAVDNGTNGQGDVTINAAGTVISSQSGTGFNAVISRTTTNRCGNFNLYGNLILTGTAPYIEFNSITFHPNSIIEFSRVSTQNILRRNIGVSIPIIYPNLIKSGSSTLTVNNSISIKESLAITAGTLALGNNDITIISDASRTANIKPVTGSVTYGTGRFVIERYLRPIKSWRFLATPVEIATSPSITDSWREGISGTAGPLTSTGYGTRITGPTGMDEITQRFSLKSYDGATNAYKEVNTAAKLGDPVANEEGYYIFVRGDRGTDVAVATPVGPTNLRIKGKIRTGNQPFTSTAATGPFDGFRSVGNPFPSQINYKTVTKNNVEPSFTIWNPNAGFYGVGRFVQYVSTTGLYGDYKNGATTLNTIESGQAFFIQSALGSTGSIDIKESDKLFGSNLVSRVGVTKPTLEINLHAINNTSTETFLDNVILNFDNSFSNAYDAADVRKINNATDNLSSKNGSFNLILERRNTLTATDTIFLNLSNTRVAAYRFEIDPSVLSNTGLEAFLQDKFLQTSTPVSFADVTNVSFNITADAASKVADRFSIVFKQVPRVNFTSIAAARNADKTITVNWGVQNEINVSTYSVEHSNDGINFSALTVQNALANNGTNPTYSKIDVTAASASNWYRVKANMANATAAYSGIAMVGALPADQLDKPAISINPNPVKDQTLNITFTNKVGKYSIALVNMEGRAVYKTNMVIASTAVVKKLALGNGIAAGQYQLTITAADGKKEILSVLVL